MNNTGLSIASRTEAPRRRRSRANLRVVYRNPDCSRWVRFRNDESSYLRFLMLQERARLDPGFQPHRAS